MDGRERKRREVKQRKPKVNLRFSTCRKKIVKRKKERGFWVSSKLLAETKKEFLCFAGLFCIPHTPPRPFRLSPSPALVLDKKKKKKIEALLVSKPEENPHQIHLRLCAYFFFLSKKRAVKQDAQTRRSGSNQSPNPTCPFSPFHARP